VRPEGLEPPAYWFEAVAARRNNKLQLGGTGSARAYDVVVRGAIQADFSAAWRQVGSSKFYRQSAEV